MDHLAVTVAIFVLCALHCVTIPVEGISTKFDVPAYFVFGDSLADVGTNNYLPNATFRANFPPYGETFFHKPTGRFTNGRNIIDFLAIKLGLPFAPPFLQPNASFTQGVNFASGGSGVLDSTDPLGSVPISVQLKQYASAIAVLQNELGTDGAKSLISKSIFLVVSGSNDISAFFQGLTTLNATQYITQILRAYETTLIELYTSGARKVVVSGTGPSGCSPTLRAHNPTNPGECLSSANTFVRGYNAGLKEVVAGLHQTIPDFNVVFANRYDITHAIITGENHFGFTNVTSGCCGAGFLNEVIQCGLAVPPGLVMSVCKRPFKYLYWDFTHPTDHATGIIFKKLWSGDESFNATYPMSIEALARL